MPDKYINYKDHLVGPYPLLCALADMIFWATLNAMAEDAAELLNMEGDQKTKKTVARELMLGDASRGGWWPRAWRLPPEGWMLAPYRTSEDIWNLLVNRGKWIWKRNNASLETNYWVVYSEEID